MCKGTIREKAEFLFDTIIGLEGIKLEKKSINWKSRRMHHAVKKMIFFAEIFPKKYQAEFMDELEKHQKDIKTSRKKGNLDRDHYYMDDYSNYSFGSLRFQDSQKFGKS